ncbi:hypothetical protein OH76DRAFT_1480752 [Lentinus brumalis]|uniref:Uncharacterized protein n=1 Tax=Lentinus brumalis TaxID=2498619 RepID=A0A371DHX0_9APHY|nr:hypothetical protein OH76DRAFT_1480752 [Polyporus brumalis]
MAHLSVANQNRMWWYTHVVMSAWMLKVYIWTENDAPPRLCNVRLRNANQIRLSLRGHPAIREAFALIDGEEVQIWSPFRQEWVTRSRGSDVYVCVYLRYTVLVRGVNVRHCPGLDDLLANDNHPDGNAHLRFREAYRSRYGEGAEHVPIGQLPTPESSDEEDGAGMRTVWY